MHPDRRRAGRAIRKRHRALRSLQRTVDEFAIEMRRVGRAAAYATKMFTQLTSPERTA